MFTEPHEKNAFLSRLAASELALFRSHLAPLELRTGDSLHRSGERIDSIIFPNSGLVTMTVPLREIAGAGGRTRKYHWRFCRGRLRAG